ncbi:acetyl-CoA carboxylase biotin carboxyl carrier protein [Psychromarinibacter sp. C21-152]|uniref:Biotin carboxyl carrier protein of acetyl-CoA carboxylase n=1 Tax=Psychromarinibacter sediminicola TaxID=3033385 RepID=A0AAE3T6R9_9RHOB|nr:acetyl-CoA carboxylase biotin carboxyl carrier protein [Psychromarinibacter sediminicola]MDF0599557.1 acetyl-CoA carboxylase biotin carboxyl carrier protein [Psychromarinibacter sediminicola]
MANPTNDDDDVAFVQAMAEILRSNDLAELEVERGSKETGKLTLRLSKVARQSAAPAAAPAPPAAPDTPATPTPPETPAVEDPADLPGAVTSPMVGTAYLSPEPGAAAFVKVGDAVAEGQTLLIVEAMKTMNHIPSPRAGTVKRVLVEDSTPVEFGAPLMVIE